MSQSIPIHQIEASPFNPRRTFPEAEQAEIEKSIEKHGLLQDVLVRPMRKKTNTVIRYQLVVGERRWRAFCALGETNKKFQHITANVRELTDVEAQEISLIENVQREDVSDFELAQGLKKKLELHAKAGEELSLRKLAALMGKNLSWVTNRLDLLKLKPELQEVAAEHPGSIMSSLFAINKVDDPELQAELVEDVKQGASFAQVTARIEEAEAEEELIEESQEEEPASKKHRLSKTQRQRNAEAEIKNKLLALRGNVTTLRSYWDSAGDEFREEHTATIRELARQLAAVGK